ncbi:MAG: ribosome silencing factor [Ignavibacteriales bacterium]|nr:ribosome silencing factor [Ignavibacteriales bacterium]
MTSRTLAKRVAEFALSKKASDVMLMDLRKLTGPSDFFVVCSADSDTQVKAIADAVRGGTDSLDVRLWHSEGFTALSWVLLDYVDVVVHIFKKDVRSFYNLERLWGDAKITVIEDELAKPKPAVPDLPPCLPAGRKAGLARKKTTKKKPAKKRAKKVSE